VTQRAGGRIGLLAIASIADQRELWWGLLTGLAIIGILGTTLQAMATMYLVRHRGSTWATIDAGGATAPASAARITR